MKYRMLAVTSAALLGSAALLAGCGGSSTASAAATPAAKIQHGGTAVIALSTQSSPNWFFPMLSASAFSDLNTQVDGMMYKPMIQFNAKDVVDYSRSLVSNITSNKNGTEYTLTLSHKYKWSNGQPITAQDVVFTWDITKAASEPNAVWVYGGAGIGGVPNIWKSVTAVGNNKVVVKLSQPTNSNWFVHNGLAQLWPVPKSVWDKYPTNMTKEMKFINSVANSPLNKVYDVVDGAYHIQSAQANNQWVFVPNKNYSGHKSILNKVIFQYETSDASEFAALKNGTISLGYLPMANYGARNLLSNDVLSPTYLLGFNYIIINMNPKAPHGLGPVFNQLYVRQALQMGIDQKTIVNGIFHGLATYEGGPVASKPNTPYSDPAVAKPLYPYNPAAGKKLLEKHGWKDVGGVMTKNGVKLQFTFLAVSGDQAQNDLQQLLQADWKKEGIKVNIVRQPFDNIISSADQIGTNPTKWNMADWGGGWTYQPDYYPSGDGLFNTGAASNFQGYSNKTEDALIQKSTQPATPAQATKALYAYEKFTAQQLAVLFLPQPAEGYAGGGDINEHIANLHGTAKTFNPVTDQIFPNYWYYTK